MDPTVRTPKSVAFLSQDASAIRAVSAHLTARGIEVLGFPTVGALAAGIGSPASTLLVLDTKALPPDQDAALLLDRVEHLCGGRPALVYIAQSGDIDPKLRALRAGAEAFFVDPVPTDELASRLIELSGAPGADRGRVLVIDDQPIAAVFAARVLESAGMETRTTGEALRVLEILEEMRPDIVLMDLHMPGADGIELTTLIRGHDELYDTPIVFLSSELNKDKQLDALRVGGNDFIAKPVRPERLIEVVRRSIRSFRMMRGRRPAGQEQVRTHLAIHERPTSEDASADDASAMISPAEQAPARPNGEGGIGMSRAPARKDADLEREKRIVELVRKALRSDGFRLLHQPIVALRDATGERYDTSLCLMAPDGERIPPLDFLPAAQRAGLIPAIDRWVMEQALDRIKQERDVHQRLQFFIHQRMETLRAEDWLPWLRGRIAERDLIKQTPILQFQVDDLCANRDLASIRLQELRRLAIETCANLPEEASPALDSIEDLGATLVKLPLPTTSPIDSARLTDLVAKAHAADTRVIVTRIESPQAIAQVFACGVDFIQGSFLQPPSEELTFDFHESALG